MFLGIKSGRKHYNRPEANECFSVELVDTCLRFKKLPLCFPLSQKAKICHFLYIFFCIHEFYIENKYIIGQNSNYKINVYRLIDLYVMNPELHTSISPTRYNGSNPRVFICCSSPREGEGCSVTNWLETPFTQ